MFIFTLIPSNEFYLLRVDHGLGGAFSLFAFVHFTQHLSYEKYYTDAVGTGIEDRPLLLTSLMRAEGLRRTFVMFARRALENGRALTLHSGGMSYVWARST